MTAPTYTALKLIAEHGGMMLIAWGLPVTRPARDTEMLLTGKQMAAF